MVVLRLQSRSPAPTVAKVPSAARRVMSDALSGHPQFLVLDLSGKLSLSIHRRMTGNLLLLPPGWEIDTSLRETDPAAWNLKGPTFRPPRQDSGQEHNNNVPGQDIAVNTLPAARPVNLAETAYCRVCFNLEDGRRLLYTDPRKFGRIELWSSEREESAGIASGSVHEQGRRYPLQGLGLEPLSDEFTVERLAHILAGRKGAIKQVLLTQEVVAGLGNIYADEALYYASIHPLRRAASLTIDEIQKLHEGIVAVLTRGIEHGGDENLVGREAERGGVAGRIDCVARVVGDYVVRPPAVGRDACDLRAGGHPWVAVEDEERRAE